MSTHRVPGRSSGGGGGPFARRRYGQNFLVDLRAIDRIVDALAPRAEDTVLEIGPGRGALTAPLLARVAPIAAVEVDRDIARALSERFGADRLVLIREDVLRLDFARVGTALGRAPHTRLAIVGNLPYNISKPIVQKLVAERERVDRSVLTFQREVADRLTAVPGTRSYGPLGILAGEAYRIDKLFDIPPGAFRPRPKVHSTVTAWRPLAGQPLSPEREAALRACLRAAFARRRGTLLVNLRHALPRGEEQARAILEAAGLDGRLRAEAVSREGFRRLAAVWPAA